MRTAWFQTLRHSREGGNPWDLPKSWTKGTELREQQGLIKIAENSPEKQCVTCIMANKRNLTLYIEEGKGLGN